MIPALALVPLLAGPGDDHFDWAKVSSEGAGFAAC